MRFDEVDIRGDSYPTTSPPASGCRRLLLPALIGLLAGTIGAVVGAAVVLVFDNPSEPTQPPLAPLATAALPLPQTIDINTAITEAVQQVGPSVVTVISHISANSTGSGSGIIISDQGHIITNSHVVADAQRLEIVLADGTRLPAELVGTDAFVDLAVISAEGTLPAAANWGNSDALKAGESVIAIGSPLGDFVNSVTAGVVSNTGRSIETGQGYQLTDLIQTDAAINQGNSGGPLVNLAGQVVGINALIVRGDSSGLQAEGLGFAIPSNTARAIAEQIITGGRVLRPYVGIQWRWITPEVASTFNLPVEFGAYVTEVVPDSPAELAGIERGDILVSLGGRSLDADNPFINVLYQFAPGDVIEVQVVRGAQTVLLNLELAERP